MLADFKQSNAVIKPFIDLKVVISSYLSLENLQTFDLEKK
jgi:hypothetical protein